VLDHLLSFSLKLLSVHDSASDEQHCDSNIAIRLIQSIQRTVKRLKKLAGEIKPPHTQTSGYHPTKAGLHIPPDFLYFSRTPAVSRTAKDKNPCDMPGCHRRLTICP
jgi:hypothetical protein